MSKQRRQRHTATADRQVRQDIATRVDVDRVDRDAQRRRLDALYGKDAKPGMAGGRHAATRDGANG